MRSRMHHYRVTLHHDDNATPDMLYEPTLKRARQRVSQMLLLHHLLYEFGRVITPDGKSTKYVRYNGRVCSESQRNAWARRDKKAREVALKDKTVQYLVTTGTSRRTIYGVIETSALTDHDLVWLTAAMLFQAKSRRADLALTEVTNNDALVRLAAEQCVEQRKVVTV